MKKKSGFTILELVIVILFASLALVLFFVQKSNMDAMKRDEDRKIAINAMYYALEEGFYTQNKYYPETRVTAKRISAHNYCSIPPLRSAYKLIRYRASAQRTRVPHGGIAARCGGFAAVWDILCRVCAGGY